MFLKFIRKLSQIGSINDKYFIVDTCLSKNRNALLQLKLKQFPRLWGGKLKIKKFPKSSDPVYYSKATGFETLIGWLFLKDPKRLSRIFEHLECK